MPAPNSASASSADPIVLLALGLLGAAPLALSPIPSALAALGIFAAMRARARPATLALAIAALVIGGLRARAELDVASAIHTRATALLQPPARCEGEGVVVGSPVILRGAAAQKQGNGPATPAPEHAEHSEHSEGDAIEDRGSGDARLDVELLSGTCGSHPIDAPLRARLYGAPEDVGRGDRVFVVADLAPVHLFLNDGLADPRPPIARSGVAASGGVVELRRIARSVSIVAWIDRARAHVRARIEATFHPDAAALARALVLGETDLDPADDEAFRVSGLSHLLAVSGTHLVLAVAGFAAALRGLLVRVGPIAARWDAARVSSAVAIPIAWIYADFAGGSGSAVRAAAMLSATMLARALGRRADTTRAFAWSMAVFAAFEPLIACDISFALSAAATLGLVVLQAPIAAKLVRGPGPVKKLLAATATTLAAMIGCAPILALLAPTLPILGVASNLIAAPLGELAALPICLAHAALSWAPAVERGAALLGSGALLGVRAVARWSSATGAVIAIPRPTAAQLAALAVSLAFAWAAELRARRFGALAVGAAAWIACEIVAVRAGAPHGVLRISALDVGQGDSILVDLPDGSAMLVDGGGFVGSPVDPGVRVVLPVLRARRRSRLALVVLSHPHPDHFGGLVSTVPAMDVGELWDSGQGEEQGAGPAYAALISGVRARNIPIRRPGELCGHPREIGGATIEVLAPCPKIAPDAGPNDNSLVLRIRYGDRTALLVGDAEHDEESTLARLGPEALHADFLKVGHHGSRTSSSPAFLEAVRPSVAAISCGVRNRFGHPTAQTLSALDRRGILALRTDRGGAIVWETDGREVRVGRP